MATGLLNTQDQAADLQRRALKSLDSLPPFSPILNRLLATLADEDVSFSALAATIEKDTVLAGNVLRVVNSAAFSCRGTVNSVAHAIAIMGLNGLRNTALACSVTRLWRGVSVPEGWSTASFNLHSIGVALLADQLAQRVDVHYPEGAFASGLFHDLGKLMIALGLPAEHKAIHSATGKKSLEEHERELIGVAHADLSALALERWNLPRPIQVGVAFHHDPASVPPDMVAQSGFSLAAVVQCADAVFYHIGSDGDGDDGGLRVAEALGLLNLSDQAGAVLEDFKKEYGVVSSLF